MRIHGLILTLKPSKEYAPAKIETMENDYTSINGVHIFRKRVVNFEIPKYELRVYYIIDLEIAMQFPTRKDFLITCNPEIVNDFNVGYIAFYVLT